jgi:ATP-dependent exoDNAse (exonuclease V) beta subunit
MEPLRARRNLSALLAMLLELPASPTVAYALLEDERAGSERGDLPASVEDADLLIQTAHGSKGLEYDDVILPLLNAQQRSFKKGDLRTRAGSHELLLAWKLGHHQGPAYRELKPLVEARQRGDELNLLYVALTRARERLCLLLQEPKEKKPHAEARTWAQWGQHLADAHPELELLGTAPAPAAQSSAVLPFADGPAARLALPDDVEPLEVHEDLPGDTRSRARQDGEIIHAFMRDLLVRWENPAAFGACLEAAPPVAQARENALRFLAQFEAQGWRQARRRTELPLAGAAASGGMGRADLVVWAGDRMHILDFKHTKTFSEAELAGYRDQLRRYAEALEGRDGLPVSTWLVALRSGTWLALDEGPSA